MKLKFLILFILILIFSCSFCYAMTTNTKSTIINQLQTLTDKGVISQATTDKLTIELNKDSTFKTSNGYGDNYFILIGKGSRFNGGGHNWYTLSTTEKIYIGCSSTSATLINNLNNNVNNMLYTFWNFQGSICCNISNDSGYLADVAAFNDTINGFYIYTTIDIDTRLIQLSAGQEFGGQYLLDYGPYFEPEDDTLINIYNNGVETNQAYRLKFGYVYPNTSVLGYIRGLHQNVYGVECYFGPSVYYSGDSYTTDGTQFSFNYNLYKGLYTNYLYFDIDTGQISVSSNRLLENQLYFLTVYYKETYDGEWQSLSTDIPFYAIKYTSNITSGDAINPNLDSTIDLTLINSLDEFLNNNNNNDYLINNEFPQSRRLI